MTPMLYVRKRVLGLTQAEMAEIAKARQGTVSKWENGELEPDRAQLGLVRAEIDRRGIAWDDRWFFEVPPTDAPATEPARAPS